MADKMKPIGNPVYPPFGGNPVTTRLQRLERGDQRYQRTILRPTTGIYARIPGSILFTKPNGQQQINLTSTTVRKIGGTSVAGNTAGFAYVATTTTITWYWDGTNGSTGIVITRGDNSKFTVPTSGSGLTISGLTPNTTYYFLPFWSPNNLCNIGWVQGTVGSPQIAFIVTDTTDIVNNPIYLMNQTLQGSEPLSNGYMTAVTTAAGTGGGGAGGGGGTQSGCVMSGTDIVPVGEIEYHLQLMAETDWIHLLMEDGRYLYCTYDHPLYHAVSGKVQAENVAAGEKLISDIGELRVVSTQKVRKVCSKYRVHMEKGHLYWANGLLSHNWKLTGL